MVELPVPSVTRLPAIEEPIGAVVGTAPAANVMVLPLTVKLSPAATVIAPRAVEGALAGALRSVAVVMGAGVVLLLLTGVLVRVPYMPPRVVPLVAGVAPPIAPVNSTLLSALALATVEAAP